MLSETRRSRFGLPVLAGLFAIAAAFAGTASINDRSAEKRASPVVAKVSSGSVADDATRSPGSARESTEGHSGVGVSDSAVRPRLRCPDCGLIESMRRIDRPRFAGGVCTLVDLDPLRIATSADDSDYGNAAMFSAPVDGVLARRYPEITMKVTSSYQIIVRQRDGSRHVFYETTPRALQSGQRVLLIAGANIPAE
jgi:hypothetical protein